MRMYGFVMYNLSGIQKGIQFGHAVAEYSKMSYDTGLGAYFDFVENHKTFIILDGGGSADMEKRLQELYEIGIGVATFREPDLNDSLSAIVFLVPENVYSLDASKDFEDCITSGDVWNLNLKKYLSSFRLASN